MATSVLFGIIVVAAVRGVVANYALSGSDVTVLKGETANLKCKVTRPTNDSANPINVWKYDSEMAFLKDTVIQADASRMSSSSSNTEMVMKIDDVNLSDEKEYFCGLNAIKPPIYARIYLTVNQYPQQFYVEDIEVTVQDGDEATVARCITKGSKPEPKMWFTDPNGEPVVLTDKAEVSVNQTLWDKTITLKKTFTKEDFGKSYTCHVQRADDTITERQTAKIQVHFAPTVSLDDVLQNSLEVLEEGKSFQASCRAEGNPRPTVHWTFTPDQNTNVSLPVGGLLPTNLQSAGAKIFTNNLVSTVKDLTNNGTLTCTANNGVGSPASASFKLGVYAAPVTTVPTTTESTPAAEPRSAGSDGAVIGGVVAVAAFVVIVAVLLIARYFMSHKGTYRTKEIKMSDDEERANDRAADEDEEFLGERKKEYFL